MATDHLVALFALVALAVLQLTGANTNTIESTWRHVKAFLAHTTGIRVKDHFRVFSATAKRHGFTFGTDDLLRQPPYCPSFYSRIWNILVQIFVFAVVGFSKCTSLYLNEREKCYGRQIYAFNPHKMVKKCVIHKSQYLKIFFFNALHTVVLEKLTY